jgi:hypothetical protein
LPSLDVDAIAPGKGSQLFCGVGGELFRSTDAGGYWSPVGSIPGPDRISAIAVDDGGKVHVGGADGGTGEFSMEDGGWTVAACGPDMGGITDLKIGPDGTLYAASRKGGAFRRPAGGESWVTCSAGLEVMNVEALALLPDGFLLAGLNGGSVVRMDLSTIAGVARQGGNRFPDRGIITMEAPVPNPATSDSKLSFSLSEAALTTVRIFSPEGKECAPPVTETLAAGTHTVRIPFASLAPGTYYLVISARGALSTRAFQLLR